MNILIFMFAVDHYIHCIHLTKNYSRIRLYVNSILYYIHIVLSIICNHCFFNDRINVIQNHEFCFALWIGKKSPQLHRLWNIWIMRPSTVPRWELPVPLLRDIWHIGGYFERNPPGRLTAGTYSHNPWKERKMIWTKPPENYVPC